MPSTPTKPGVLAQLKSSESELNHIRDHYPAAGEYAGRLRSVLEELKDINGSAAAACERLDADPERLAKCSARLDTLIALQQKHRAADEAELIAVRDRCTAQLAAIVHSDEEIAQAEAALGEVTEKGRCPGRPPAQRRAKRPRRDSRNTSSPPLPGLACPRRFSASP